MQQETVEKIYKGLKSGKKVDVSRFLQEEYKEYRELPSGKEVQTTKVTLELAGGRDPAIIASMYVDKTEIESHFYYLDQKAQLRQLLHKWLKI